MEKFVENFKNSIEKLDSSVKNFDQKGKLDLNYDSVFNEKENNLSEIREKINEKKTQGLDYSPVYEKENLSKLSESERNFIVSETNWSKEIVDCIKNMEQYNIYKNADLHETTINGRKCLIKNIDKNYLDKKTGFTNKELMEKGRAPYDSKTGEKIELHHMDQSYDSPLAELCENSEHGDGKDIILHDKTKESWRNNTESKHIYNNVERPNHWLKRGEMV